MSKAITKIPSCVKEVKALMPKDAFIHDVRLSEDKETIEIEWDSPAVKSPFTFPVEISVADLQKSVNKPAKRCKTPKE